MCYGVRSNGWCYGALSHTVEKLRDSKWLRVPEQFVETEGVAMFLDGVSVFECSERAGVGFAGRLLMLQGAAVSRIVVQAETPLGPTVSTSEDVTEAVSAYIHDGKGRVAIDCHDGVVEAIARVAIKARSSVVLVDASFRDRYGVSIADLAAKFQGVLAVLTPYGESGPRSQWAATGLTTFHSGGEGFLLPSGMSWEEFPDRAPVQASAYLGEYQSGITLAVAVVGALIRATVSGKSERVEVSEQEAQIALSQLPIQRLQDGTVETRQSRQHTYNGVVPCSDGFVELLTLEQHQWEAQVRVMGNPAWAAEYVDASERGRRGDEINALVRGWSRDLTREQIVERSRREGLPAGMFRDASEVLQRLRSQTPEMLVTASDVKGSDGGPVSLPGNPWREL